MLLSRLAYRIFHSRLGYTLTDLIRTAVGSVCDDDDDDDDDSLTTSSALNAAHSLHVLTTN
jgi:hypothetical protein